MAIVQIAAHAHPGDVLGRAQARRCRCSRRRPREAGGGGDGLAQVGDGRRQRRAAPRMVMPRASSTAWGRMSAVRAEGPWGGVQRLRDHLAMMPQSPCLPGSMLRCRGGCWSGCRSARRDPARRCALAGRDWAPKPADPEKLLRRSAGLRQGGRRPTPQEVLGGEGHSGFRVKGGRPGCAARAAPSPRCPGGRPSFARSRPDWP